MNCLYFGVHQRAGHVLHGGSSGFDRSVTTYGPERQHIDGALAPRRDRAGEIFFAGAEQRHSERENSSSEYECPQGQYLLHHLPNGYSAVQWWDRNQGDGRGACNSTILLRGVHDAATVLAAGREKFPHVFENLKKAGVELVEVKLGASKERGE